MASNTNILLNAVSASGASTTGLDVRGLGFVAFQVTGTFVATVAFECTVDGATWVSLNTSPINGAAAATSATAPGVWVASCAGLVQVRANVTWTSGTSVTVRAFATDATGAFSTSSTAPANTTSVFGTKSLTTTAAAALTTSQAAVAVTVTNPVSNSIGILVGDSGSQPEPIAPGEAIRLCCTNVNQIYAKNASSTTQTINWIAEVLS